MPEPMPLERIRVMLRERQDARSASDIIGKLCERIIEGDAQALAETLRDVPGIELLDDMPQQRYLFIANFMLHSVDAASQRIAASPTISDVPSDSDKTRSVTRARLGSRVKQSWWTANDMELANYQIARNLLVYGEAPITSRVDTDRKIPIYRELDPLNSWTSDERDWRPTPRDMVSRTEIRLWELRGQYPYAQYPLDWTEGQQHRLIEVITFVSATETVVFATGSTGYSGTTCDVLLDRIPNRVGLSPFVAPRLLSAGSRRGAFNQLVGIMAAKAHLQMLSLAAAERGVFPDTFISGRTIGKLNVGPDAITELEKDAKVWRLGYQSSFQLLQELDRLTAEMRIEANYPAQLSGETPSTLATGKGNQTLLSSTIDQGIKERQLILGVAYRHLFERSTKQMKSYLGNVTIPVQVDEKDGSHHVLEYKPNDLTEGTTRVEYGMLSASDIGAATVVLGQLHGLGMPLRDILVMHPLVKDPDGSLIRADVEKLDALTMMALEKGAMEGQIDTRMLIKMKRARESGKDLDEAYEKALEEMAEQSQAGELAPMVPQQVEQPPQVPGPPPSPAQILQSSFGGAA